MLDDPFHVTSALLGDPQGSPNNGVNRDTDRLTVRFAFQPNVSFADLIDGLNNGRLRVGLHLRAIGLDEDSDSFVSAPPESVPLPGAAGLASIALLGLAGGRRRR